MKALRLDQFLVIFLVIAGHSTGHGQAPVAGAGGAQSDGARPTNRLAREKSPYLLQHAHNPVDWYPWGAEALERAKKEGKPIFLSIGYATCHWCHVMERESFENPVIAAFLNASFVAIKVDREERPDIDAVYMAACLAQTGNGGWPLTAVLTPEGKPFFVGTYFPPEDDPRRGRGLLTILKQIEKLWREDRQNLEKHAEHFTETLRKESNVEGARKTLGWPAVRRAYQRFRDQFDDARGGFGQAPRFAPKFPRTVVLDLLLAYSATREARESGTSSPALQMVLSTLEAMSRGGIRDHLGGGFHRYSTDRQWLVPHFEKMLYDQALIARTLVGAWRQTRSQPLLQTARETLDYALRRLRAPGGAFYSAEDADTEGVEGKTYVWDRGEILQALGEEAGGRFAEIYGVTAAGNFHDAGPGLNVLSLALEGGETELARKLGRPADEIGAELSRSRARLLEIRDRRPQPRLDDKVLTEWNGLMISALSHAAQVTQEERYRVAARQAAGFLLENLVRDGRLLRRWREGEASVGAFLEDHAAFAEGLIDLYETTFEVRWLEAAVQLTERMLEEFWDEADGAFFSSGQRNEALIARAKEFYDGALPAGNSVALHVLLRLGSLTEKERFRSASSRLLETAGLLLDRDDESPTSRPYLLAGALRALTGAREIVIVGAPGDPRANELLLEAQARYLPGRVLVLAQSAEEVERLKSLVPLVEGRWPQDGKAAAYVCRDGVCKLPARDREGFLRALAE